MKNKQLIWVVVAAQALFLLGWAGWHEHVRATAPTVLLKTRPIDPRDILRGDYMILNYEISRHAAPIGWAGDETRAVYVMFKLEDGHGQIDEVLLHEPAASDRRLYAQAEAAQDSRARGALQLTYGIEQFFVPEGKGTPRFKTLEVEAAVSPAHRLYIKRVLLDGKPYP
jgi:uncharacterized membrane-anchored protein